MEHPHGPDTNEDGLDRRALLRRSAVVAGALVWTTPVVQTIAQPAFAEGSPPPGPEAICPPGNRRFFQWRRLATQVAPAGLQSTPTTNCSPAATAPVTTETSLVSVTFEQIPRAGTTLAGQMASRARITLAPGYVLVFAQPKSADQTNANGNCAARVTPAPVAGDCDTGRVYLVDSTGTDPVSGRRANLQLVSGELRCDGCA